MNDEFNKFKEDTEKEIKKIRDILLAPHADAESSEQGGKVAERYFHLAVRANENVAALELKVKENEETINKLIIENHAKALTEINEKHVKVIGDITRLHAKVDGVSYVTQDDHVEALSETLRAVEAYKHTHEQLNAKINSLKCRFDIARPRRPATTRKTSIVRSRRRSTTSTRRT